MELPYEEEVHNICGFHGQLVPLPGSTYWAAAVGNLMLDEMEFQSDPLGGF